MPPAYLSKADLCGIAHEARDTTTVQHHCWEINRTIRDDIWSWVETHGFDALPEYYAGLYKTTVTDRDQSGYHGTHYVTLVDSQIVDETITTSDDGVIIVDAALDQFNDAALSRDAVPLSFGPRETIANVIIAPPHSSFRKTTYHRHPTTIDPTTDFTVALPV